MSQTKKLREELGNLDDWTKITKSLLRKDKIEIPEFKEHCVCGHEITNQYYIINKFNQYVEVVGSVCIYKFFKRKCTICSKEHKNTSTSLCNICRYMIECTQCNKRYPKEKKKEMKKNNMICHQCIPKIEKYFPNNIIN